MGYHIVYLYSMGYDEISFISLNWFKGISRGNNGIYPET